MKIKDKIKETSGYSYRTNQVIKVQEELIKALKEENARLKIMIDDLNKIKDATHKENAPNQSQQTKPYKDAEALRRSPIKMDKPAGNIHTEIIKEINKDY